MLKKVQTYIQNGNLQEAIRKVIGICEAESYKDCLKESILISSQICRTNNDFNLGLISYNDREVKLTRLSNAILALGDAIKKNPFQKKFKI